VAVVGPSGSGKSSVIGAGLIPRLAMPGPSGGAPGAARHSAWQTPAFDPGRGTWTGARITPAGSSDDPLRALALALGADAIEAADDFATRCREACAKVLAGGRRQLIYVDQFEETYNAVPPAAARELVDTLVRLADDDLATVVLSLRADFLGAALRHDGLARRMRAATLPLGPPGLTAIGQMIAEPARVAGLTFDADLPELLLVDTRREPGGLPLLAFALAELYAQRDGDRLTHAAYAAIGGVRGAVGRLAERHIERLPGPVRDELGSVFRRLVELDEVGGPVRRKVSLSAVSAEPRHRALVDALVAARLLVVGAEPGGEPYLELAHEALFRGWPRLTEWLESAHGDLRTLAQMRRAAADWRSAGRDPLLLWPHERLTAVHAALERLDPELSDDERDFLRPEAVRLLDELARPGTDHRRRREISARLATIGDPRPGVGTSPDGLPDIAWRPVRGEAGERFWIGRYPVTVAQIAAYRELSMVGSPVRGAPEDHAGNTPAAVTWGEAVLFCDWLGRAAERGNVRLPDGTPPGYEVRLPTEAEWMRAAGDGRFPWGEEFDESRANTETSGLGMPLAVGMYPAGDGPSGASDLAGSVWEWCRDDLGERERTAASAYPLRILKGGSAHARPDRCTVHYRQTMRGDVWRPDRGFRVCLGPAYREAEAGSTHQETDDR
jgi:hypothetical protein